MIRRILLAAALAAPALALVPATPASAGCVEDYVAPSKEPFPTPDPDEWVVVNGVVVTVDGQAALDDVAAVNGSVDRFTAHTYTFVDCVF